MMGDTPSQITIAFASYSQSLELANLISSVISKLTYYNDLAKAAEINKFCEESIKSRISSDPQSTIIAMKDDRIVGFILTRFDDFLIWIEWFAVDSSARGNGISTLLLDAAENCVRNQGCHKIWCDTRTSNEASKHILSKRGYDQIVTVTNHWYGQDFILWEKSVL